MMRTGSAHGRRAIRRKRVALVPLVLLATLLVLGPVVTATAQNTSELRALSLDIQVVAADPAGRAESLDRVLGFLSDANVSATLAFERELRSLNEEIEYYEGRRRAILNDSRYARVTVRLSVRTRSIPQAMPSSFPWINSISLYRFIDRLNQEGRR